MDAQKLRKYLEIRCNKMYAQGVTNIKEFEIAFQDVIEKAYPDKCWWQVTDCQIFMELLETRDPDKVIDSIIAQLKDQPVTESEDLDTQDYTDVFHMTDKNGDLYEAEITLTGLSEEDIEEIEENGYCNKAFNYSPSKGFVVKDQYFKSCSVYDPSTKQDVEISYEEYVAFVEDQILPLSLDHSTREEDEIGEGVELKSVESPVAGVDYEWVSSTRDAHAQFSGDSDDSLAGKVTCCFDDEQACKDFANKYNGDLESVEGLDNCYVVRINDISKQAALDMLTDLNTLARVSSNLGESFSKVAYDQSTLEMLELKLPEEVIKQKEELNQCKEFKDEKVNQKPDAKLKELKSLNLDDKSVTGEQETNEGEIEINDNEVSPKEAAKEVKLKESVSADMMFRLRQEIEKLSDYMGAEINLRKSENKVYISAELDYSELYDVAERLNPIIQEYDADAYFDAEEQGLWVAYFHNLDLNEMYDTSLAKPHYNDLISAIEDGFVSYEKVALACLDFMSDDEIAELCRLNDFNIGTDFEE